VRRNQVFRSIVLGAVLPMLFLADFRADGPFGLGVAREVQAIVGAPLSPVSVAGVARRTTRRVVVAESAAVQASAAATTQQQQAVAQQQSATAQQQAATAQQQAATAAAQQAPSQAGSPAIGSVVSVLPAGCTPVTQGGVAYQKCGNVFYRAAFQGNNLVYVVQQP
jgi:hypothetical protein